MGEKCMIFKTREKRFKNLENPVFGLEKLSGSLINRKWCRQDPYTKFSDTNIVVFLPSVNAGKALMSTILHIPEPCLTDFQMWVLTQRHDLIVTFCATLKLSCE